MGIEIKVKPEAVLRFLLFVISELVALHIVWQMLNLLMHQEFFPKNPLVMALAWFFNVNREGNLPSLYSTLALLTCSALLTFIGSIKVSQKAKYAIQWLLLGLIFLGAAWDEGVQVHERLINSQITEAVFATLQIEPTGVFAFGSWIVIVLPILFLLSLYFLRFFLHLPKRQKRLIILSGGLFLSGSVITELFGSLLWESSGYNMVTAPYILIVALEESLEMLGVAVLIYALLNYISEAIGSFSCRILAGSEFADFKFGVAEIRAKSSKTTAPALSSKSATSRRF